MAIRPGGSRWERWARLRYSIIAPLLTSPLPAGKLRETLALLASKEYVHPFRPDDTVTFGVSSIERWYYLARRSQDPIAALGRKIRADAGSERVMSARLMVELESQFQAHRRWSYQLHWDNLVALVQEKPELGPVPSYATLVRRMKRRGWVPQKRTPRHPTPGQAKAARRLERREVRSYEKEYPHALWHSDGHQGSRKVVDSLGRYHRVVMIAFLDDCSRLCAHGQWYLTEDAECFIHCLRQALSRRGLPRQLMTDRGSAMMAGETQNGLARLGVIHCPTLPSSPYQNGKMEEFWSQVEGRLLPMLENMEPLTLSSLNRATQAWLEMEYHRRPHEALGKSPLDRLLEGHSVARMAPDSQTMSLAFCIEETRSQRLSDGTITIRGVRFEIPSAYRFRAKVRVKYQSFDLSQAYLVDEGSGELLSRLQPQDKLANASGIRRSHEPIAWTPALAVPPSGDPMPPLMRRLMRDYEATGLPPAYLPLDREDNEYEQETHDE